MIGNNRNVEGFRVCNTCKKQKPATTEFFYKQKSRYLGIDYRCIECDKQKQDNRVWADRWASMSEETRNNQRAQKRKYNKSHAGKCIHLLKAYEKFDKKKGFVTDINKHDIDAAKNGKCVYCGFPASGLDRISNKEGHTKSNCVPCCQDCNTARMDNFTHEEMFILGETIRQIKKARTSQTTKQYVISSSGVMSVNEA